MTASARSAAIAPTRRALAAAGAVLAAASVGLAAYASHLADAGAGPRLLLAAMFGFGHGLALACLAPRASRRLDGVAMSALLAGVLLFSGSLFAAYAFGWPTRLAPAGGMLMMVGWLLHAADAARS